MRWPGNLVQILELAEENDFENTIEVFLKRTEMVVEVEDRSDREGMYLKIWVKFSKVRMPLILQHLESSDNNFELYGKPRACRRIHRSLHYSIYRILHYHTYFYPSVYFSFPQSSVTHGHVSDLISFHNHQWDTTPRMFSPTTWSVQHQLPRKDKTIIGRKFTKRHSGQLPLDSVNPTN